MLENIKSVYFLRILFPLLEVKKKLDLLKYNKNLQNKIDININYYKVFSGKYIEYENKEKANGKEYNIFTNNLIFEGEYLNRKRNGYGKEYNHYNELIFEGDYLNGKRWNGKIYSSYKYDDYYVLKNGKGFIEETTFNEDIIFKADFLNGRLFIDYDYAFDIIKYRGQYLNGERNGKGIEYNYNNNILFEGEYLNGKRWNGKLKTKYGEFELNKGKGFIKEINYKDYYTFEGEYLNGKRNGKGKEYDYYNDNLIFEGEYFQGIRWKGTEYEYNYEKLIFEKKYLNGEIVKIKEYNYLNGGLVFEGEYKKGKRNGKGKEIKWRNKI